MGPNRVECVVLLTWTLLLLGLGQGWTEITGSQFKNILAGRYSVDTVRPDSQAKLPIKLEVDNGDEDDDDGDDEDYEDEDYDDEEDPFYDTGEDNEDLDLKSENYEPQTTAAPKPGPDKKDSTGFDYKCSENEFKISLSKKEVGNFKVIGLKDLLSIQEAVKSCGYNVNKEQGTLTVPFTGCFVKNEQMEFSLQLLLAGGSQVRTATCPRTKQVSSGPSPRAGLPGQISLNCPFTTPKPPQDPVPQQANEPLFGQPPGWPTVPPPGWRTRQPAGWRTRQPMTWPTARSTTLSTARSTTLSTTRSTARSTTLSTTRSTTRPTTSPTVQPTRQPTVQPNQNCAVSTVERVPCGGSRTNMQSCQAIGCCWDFEFSSCFYPMDECTQDYYFLFSIYHNSASIPLDPASLVIPGTNCRPVILTDTVAVFKFKMDQCGTRSFTVGGTQVYFAEVQTVVEVLNLKYGVISRSSQLRFLIECRYSSSEKTSLASTGYMVKTPSSTVPSVLFSDGLYGVELKLATDETYTSFHPTYHQPLRLLLGKPVYLQLHLVSPTPEAVIIVNYCIAYPRSASNALVLVHEGCANPLDPHTSVLINSDFGEPRNERRFKVTAFQFMAQNTNQYLDEEIYFMCSTEVCFELEGPCEESCFDGVVGFNRINEK